ncbi:MAG: tetratricopeptide repeat protein, partial [Bacteroidota bacterium]
MLKNILRKSKCFCYSFFFLLALLFNLSISAQSELESGFLQKIEELEKKGLYVDALAGIMELGKSFEGFTPSQKIQYLKEKGHLQSMLYQLDSATVNLEKALRLCKADSLNFLPAYADGLYKLSLNNLLGRQSPEDAMQQLQLSTEIRASHDSSKVPETKLLRQKFLMREGKFAEVVQNLDDLLGTKQRLDDRLLGKIYQEYGISLIFLRRHPEAIQKLNESINFFEAYHASTQHPDVILSYTYLGYICGITGKLFSGRKYCEQALSLQKKYYPDEHPDLGILHYYAGGVYNQLEEFDRAVASFKEAIRIDNLLHGEAMSNRKANFFMSLGAAYKGQDKFDQALVANQKAIDFFESLPQQALFVDQLYSNIGMIHIDRGDLANGLKYLDLAMEIALKNFPEDHPSMVNRYNAYADLYKKKEDYARALSYLDKASRVEGKRSGALSSRIAKFRIKQANLSRTFLKAPQKALAYNELASEALGIADWQEQETYGFSQISLEFPGALLELCIEWGRTLLTLAETKTENTALEEKAFGILLAGERLIDSTREHYFTQESKLALASKGRILYEEAIDLAFDFYQRTQKEKYLETAFRLSEKSKSLLLLLGLKQVQALQNSGIPSEILDREQELAKLIMKNKSKLMRMQLSQKDSLHKVLFALQNSRDSLIQELENNYPSYHRIKYKPDLAETNFVQESLLANGEASLMYFISSNFIYRFYVEKEFKSLDRKTLAPNFSQKIQSLRELIYAPVNSQDDQAYQKMQQDFQELSHEFYQILLGGLAIKEDIQKLRIIPDG